MGSKTILVVDDEPLMLDLVESILERPDRTVLAVGSPGDALRLAEEHGSSISLLVTDMRMAEMNGDELARRVEVSSPGVKILFMSGERIEGFDAGADSRRAFISKPFSVEDLTRRVDDMLGTGD